MTSSATACFSGGNCESVSQLFIRSGAFDCALYFYGNSVNVKPNVKPKVLTDLEIFRVLQPRWVRDDRDVCLVLERKIERRRGTEAVAGRAEARDALCLECLDDLVDDGFPRVVAVAGEPVPAVEGWVAQLFVAQRVAVQDIDTDSLVPVLGEAIGEKLTCTSQGYVECYRCKLGIEVLTRLFIRSSPKTSGRKITALSLG